VAGIVVLLAGVIEFATWRRLYLAILPENVLSAMLAANPLVAGINEMVDIRNGLWRSSSVFIHPLSFGEFSAMIAPIGAYFLLDGQGWRERVLGMATVAFATLGVVCSGARGGYVAFLVALPILSILWTIRYTKLNPHSLVSALMFFVFAIGATTVWGAVIFWPRAHVYVLGGDETVASDDGRIEQWILAQPQILSNPVTGHGVGEGAQAVGWRTQGGQLTLDSYIATLLVETGVPGLLFFLGMLAIPIFVGARLYLSDADRRAAIAGPLACSVLAFSVYRMTLSRVENHILFFLMIGLMFTVFKSAHDRWAKNGYTSFPNAAVQRSPAPSIHRPA
jgi:O-antigen ligase